MRDGDNTRKRHGAARKLLLAILISCLSGLVLAESRTATTMVGLRVERHTGLYLPATSSGFPAASFKPSERPALPSCFGNGRPQLMVSPGRSRPLVLTVNSSAPERLVVTAFEP